jgi:hypothetical protein
LPEYFAFPESDLPQRGPLVIKPDRAYQERAWDDARHGRLPEAPLMSINLASVWDQTLAPPGCHTASFWIQFAPVHLAEGTWPERREEMAERLLTQLDKYSWANPETGELMFTWSSSERANIPLEWAQPDVLYSMSKLTNSPAMLVDAADRIVIAFAVTLNEERGIYLIQSDNLGETWSLPVKVFDAVSEGWEMVDQPRLTVSGDGALHLLLTRYTLLGEPQPVELYYSRSEDGGNTWIPAETVSEQPVQWSEIVAYQNTVHRFWQEQTGVSALTNHQSSTDAGFTWSPAVRIPTDALINSRSDVLMERNGTLHFLQVIGQDAQELQEWEFTGERWQLVENRKVSAQDLSAPPVIESGITLEGIMYALLQFETENPLNDGIETSLLNVRRSIPISEPGQPYLASISTPSISALSATEPDLQLTPSVTPPPLAVLNDQGQGNNRNIIGIVLVTTVVIFLLVFTIPRRSKGTDNPRPWK